MEFFESVLYSLYPLLALKFEVSSVGLAFLKTFKADNFSFFVALAVSSAVLPVCKKINFCQNKRSVAFGGLQARLEYFQFIKFDGNAG